MEIRMVVIVIAVTAAVAVLCPLTEHHAMEEYWES
jgi:hypothetical protein